MKITIVYLEELSLEELETVLLTYEKSWGTGEAGESDQLIDDEDNEIGIAEEAILLAYDAIFNCNEVEQLKRTDGEGRDYATPGDVRKALEFYPSTLKRFPTTPRIGRVMKNKLGLKPGLRRSEGIPYYWDENKEKINELIELIVN